MSKSDQKLVPELRFPGFEGAWPRKKLEEIAQLTSSKRIYLSDYVKKGVPFFRGKEISELKRNSIPQDILYISAKKYTELKSKFGAPKKNDILITAVGTLGNVYRIRDDSSFYFKDGNLIWLRDIEEDSIFLEQLIDWKKDELIKVSIGSTQKALTIIELNKVRFSIPSLPEQTRIAAFLSAVDKRITLLKKKKEALEQYKKGVMQKIFSGELRFKDGQGNNFPDWKEKKLGEIYLFKSTNSLSREKLNYVSGEVRNIHYGDIHTKFKSHFILADEDVPFINDEVALLKFSDETFAREGDLIFADASEDYNDIGKTIEIVDTGQEKIVAGLHTIHARRIYLNDMTVGFAGHLMKVNDIRLKVMRIAQGTKVLGISVKRISEIVVDLPSLLEQQKIATFLTSIDNSIENLTTQINSTQTWKKGLLQRMFV